MVSLEGDPRKQEAAERREALVFCAAGAPWAASYTLRSRVPEDWEAGAFSPEPVPLVESYPGDINSPGLQAAAASDQGPGGRKSPAGPLS